MIPCQNRAAADDYYCHGGHLDTGAAYVFSHVKTCQSEVVLASAECLMAII